MRSKQPGSGARFLFAVALIVVGLVFPLVPHIDVRGSALPMVTPLPSAIIERTAPAARVAVQVRVVPTRRGAPTPIPAATAAVLPSSIPTLSTPTNTPALLPTLTHTPVPLDVIAALATPIPTPQPATVTPQVASTVQPGTIAPILMYHYIRTVDVASDPMGYQLSVTPELFEQHLEWLAAQGYMAVRMDVLARCMRGIAGEGECPAKPIALTFDDGYEDAYTAVLPALQRYGFSATFYIISGFVGRPGYLNWEQLAALRDAGMEIGAHSIDHPNLTALDPATAEWQITHSKATLEQGLGITVTGFCYPAGQYDSSVASAVLAAGFTYAVTTRWDSDYTDLSALPRRRVEGGATVKRLAEIVGVL